MSAVAGRRFEVTGMVQGVGYRAFARRAALRLGLSGSAENWPDGSVLVQAFGSERDLATFEEELRRGPPPSRVDQVVVTKIDVPHHVSTVNRFIVS